MGLSWKGDDMAVADSINKVFDIIKGHLEKVDLKKWSQEIGGSSAEAVHAALYFLLAFGVGFLLKKYCRYVLSGVVIALIMIKLLDYNQLISIDWAAIKALTGVGSAADLNTLVNTSIVWIKGNIFLFGASVIGVLLGYRLG
ncbi:hypothetical protein FJ364_00345 [Candidatus Dependentiae bacterium]|nr:hypothetical protein [Candidatus Dependentiae bacterium]